MREATRPPVLQCFREERPHVLRESSPGRVAGCGAGQGHSGRACPRPGFLEGARDIWLSRSATSSVAPVPFFSWVQLYTWLPRGLSGKECARRCRRNGFDPWFGKIPWRRKWQPTPVFLPGESHGQRSLVGYSPWGRKESDTAEWVNSKLYKLRVPGLQSSFPCQHSWDMLWNLVILDLKQ